MSALRRSSRKGVFRTRNIPVFRPLMSKPQPSDLAGIQPRSGQDQFMLLDGGRHTLFRARKYLMRRMRRLGRSERKLLA
jgi:hypothetical protein